jgi:hypothetical protein
MQHSPHHPLGAGADFRADFARYRYRFIHIFNGRMDITEGFIDLCGKLPDSTQIGGFYGKG